MRYVRHRAGLITSIVLAWQLLALTAVSAAVCCLPSETSAVMDQSTHLAHAEHASHHSAHSATGGGTGSMTHSTKPACPLHPEEEDCDCPTFGCANTDTGFMALLGSIGILSVPTPVITPQVSGDAVPVSSPSGNSLAPVPLAPPPRC